MGKRPVIRMTRFIASRSLAAALVLSACSTADDPASLGAPQEGGLLFLVQTEPATVVMEALYEGEVRRDDRGCIRLATEDRHTVVWPFGFKLGVRSDGPHVLDERGRDVGRIGGSFRLGGGEVPYLHDGIPLGSAHRAAAEARCPGRYWIVGAVP